MIQLKAHAKLNWYLQVLGKRPDGYHDLLMVNQRLALHDELAFEQGERLTLTIEGQPQLENDDSNLVLKAARLLHEKTGVTQGARITLKKRIPMGAGLGGGSADAAATLMGLNQLWSLGLDIIQLEAIGVALGADVPYCLHTQAAILEGIGERISLVSTMPSYDIVLLMPEASLQTKEVFSRFRLDSNNSSWNATETVNALQNADLERLQLYCGNSLQQPASHLVPGIHRLIQKLKQAGAMHAQMTGAGSAVYGVFSDKASAASAMAQLQDAAAFSCVTYTI